MKTVVFALAQVVVIVLGILAAGLVHKFTQTDANGIGFLVHYGYLIFAVPLLWTSAISLMRFRGGLIEDINPLEVVSGFYLTAFLALALIWIPLRAFGKAYQLFVGGTPD